MRNKSLLFVIAILVLGGGFYLYDTMTRPALAPQTSGTMPQTENQTSPVITPSTKSTGESQAPTITTPKAKLPSVAQFSDESDMPQADVLVSQINYTDSGFEPKTVNIRSGDIVIFHNNSSTSVWPASDAHPTHTNYPGFDSKKALVKGEEFTFTFTKVGTWGFHNHMNPAQTGTVVVK